MVTYIEQISYLIFLKLLDEEGLTANCALVLVPPAAMPHCCTPHNPSATAGATGASRAAHRLRDFIRDRSFLHGLALARDEPEVAEYFRDAVLEIVDNVLSR